MASTQPLINAVKVGNVVECRRFIETGEANVIEDRDGCGMTALQLGII